MPYPYTTTPLQSILALVAWLENGCDVKQATNELRLIADRLKKDGATKPEPTVAPSIHEQDAKAYKAILDEARASLGLRDGDSLVAAIQQLSTADPLDTPLPCDIRVGHVTHKKGVPLRSLVTRMEALAAMVKEFSPLAPAASVSDALDRMDAILDPACGLLNVVYDSATVLAAMEDMRLIRAILALRPAQAGVPDDIVKDAQRYRWLLSWLNQMHLLRAEFGQMGEDRKLSNWWMLNAPYGIDKTRPFFGHGKTADEAIDAAMLAAAPAKEGGA